MNREKLTKLLLDLKEGKTTAEETAGFLEHLYYEDISYATIDHHRGIRKGFPEVIFGEGKTACQITGIMERMSVQEQIILVTRVNNDKAEKILSAFPQANYHDDARMVVWKTKEPEVTGNGLVLVLSAGTSDIPIAREAAITAQMMGNSVKTVFDVGVAGIHRLFRHRSLIEEASVLVVVAGMEGALPSVVAGMVQNPVIAVPTSIGYGISLNGITALFSMLNCCSSNVAVVNIDNGFGAGYMASSINHIHLKNSL